MSLQLDLSPCEYLCILKAVKEMLLKLHEPNENLFSKVIYRNSPLVFGCKRNGQEGQQISQYTSEAN
jgi:hypothetical protein